MAGREARISAGVLIAAVVIGSIHVVLTCKAPTCEKGDDENRYPMMMPKVTGTAVLSKISLLIYSIKRLIIERPSKGVAKAKQQQNELSKKECVGGMNGNCEKRTVYFIRHGQSAWNHTFDKSRGLLRVLLSTIQLVFFEVVFAVTNDSFMFDTPLSTRGINQALELAKNISESNGLIKENIRKVLMDEEGSNNIKLYTSNLRRAQSTLMLALQKRISEKKERVTVLGELEETVGNPDCVSLYTNFGCSTAPCMEVMMVADKVKKYSDILLPGDVASAYSLSLYEKMLQFNNRIFHEKEQTLIVCGHSRWIRYYMSIFLPQASNLEYKNRKIGNVDMLRFDVYRKQLNNGDHFYMVDEASVELVYKNKV